jgi:hypothetical protein
MEDVADILRIGDAQKRRAATAMNDRSSRAHALFILTLTQTRLDSSAPALSSSAGVQSTTRTSRLFLADLGGSEQVKKSKVEAGGLRVGIDDQFSLGFEMAQHMREAVYINLGLLALKKVIEALNNKFIHVPYHDSKLTMLLSAGLGGNCKTSVIVCANMDPEHATETVASLRFGERCSLIETEARNNANLLAAVLRDLDRRISELEQKIKEKERWELREEQRTDELAEEGTVEAVLKIEVKKIYVPVGAEAERMEMEKLLKQRAKVCLDWSLWFLHHVVTVVCCSLLEARLTMSQRRRTTLPSKRRLPASIAEARRWLASVEQWPSCTVWERNSIWRTSCSQRIRDSRKMSVMSCCPLLSVPRKATSRSSGLLPPLPTLRSLQPRRRK